MRRQEAKRTKRKSILSPWIEHGTICVNMRKLARNVRQIS